MVVAARKIQPDSKELTGGGRHIKYIQQQKTIPLGQRILKNMYNYLQASPELAGK